MQKITPFLWFDTQAEEAMNFYISIFRNSKVLSVNRYGEAGPGPKGTVLVKLLSDPDPVKAQPVMAAMMKMKKTDIAALQRACVQR
jgi:predicted 3-demethylubiquinone-9 3-methyltransferase (glyoxalase superfamily)